MKRISFITPVFPATSETWFIDQIANLRDRGIQITVFAFRRGSHEKLSQKYHEYRMGEDVMYLDMPRNFPVRLVMACPKVLRLLWYRPAALFRAFNVKRFGKRALTLQLLYWAAPFAGRRFDLHHCHFGHGANMFLDIRYVLGDRTRFVTTFYGMDISHKVKEKGVGLYDDLKKSCSGYFVMSSNMRERVIAFGFKASKVHVLPISLDIDAYPFRERVLESGETIRLTSVGRFVEKKGFDDLLRALAIVKQKMDKRFVCNLVGFGALDEELRSIANELGVDDVVTFTGRLDQQEIINLYGDTHLYIQPSKTASSGDME